METPLSVDILIGDNRKILPTLEAESVQCCVTSPPYFGLRDYGNAAQIGLEPTPDAFVAELVTVFREVWRVLRNDGTLWLNLGDSYAHSLRQSANQSGNKQNTNEGSIRRGFAPITPGYKEKDLMGIPWRVAFALQSEGWYLRSDIIWHKPNPMPESVTDRPTKAHEYLFLLTKSERYYYDAAAIAEDAVKGAAGSSFSTGKTATHQLGRASTGARIENETRNRRSVWTVPSSPYSGAHFATFPPALIEPCILAGTSPQACEVCRAPWRRVVERTRENRSNAAIAGTVVTGKGHPSTQARENHDIRNGPTVTTKTLGWEASCTCPDATGSGRCVVLDPFGGAGTTGVVADRLGRSAVLIELNPEYAKLAHNRATDDAPLFAAVTSRDAVPTDPPHEG